MSANKFAEKLRAYGIVAKPGTLRTWWARGAPRNLRAFVRWHRNRGATRAGPIPDAELDWSGITAESLQREMEALEKRMASRAQT